MPSVRSQLTSTHEVPAPRSPGSMLHYTAWVGVVTSFGAAAVALALSNVAPAVGSTLTGLAFLVMTRRIERGRVEEASTWLIGICLGWAIYTHVLFGGLSGWSYVPLTFMPMLAILLERGSRIVGTRVFALSLAMLIVALVTPDVWWFGALTVETTQLMRLGTLTLTVGGAGVLATYAMRRLETAMATAIVTEHQARKASDRKTSFLANISHELRTPMNAILGYSELVLEDDDALPRERRDDVRRIRNAGEDLLSLINEVLRLARPETAGRAARCTCDVPALVERWVTASHGGLTSTVDPTAALATVQVEPGKLDTMVRDVVEGYRRRRINRIALTVRMHDEAVKVTFRPRGLGPGNLVEPPVTWLVVEQAASSQGVRMHRHGDGRINLYVPVQTDASRSPLPLERGLLGIALPRVPHNPMDALRARLAVRVALLSIAIIAVVGPVTDLLHEGEPLAVAPVLGWVTMLGVALLLYRAGRHDAGAAVLAGGQIVALTLVQGVYGGAHDIGMIYFTTVTVLGALIVGSRWGLGVTALAVVGVGLVATGDQLGLLPPAPPDTRLQIVFVVGVATGVSTVLVSMWSRPLERLVDAASEAAAVAAEADRSTSDFLDVVSIELRTPLNAILGYAEMLIEDAPDPEIRADLTRIVDAGRHLLAVVDDLLDMSAIVADQLEIDTERIEVAALLASVANAVRPLVERRGNWLALEVDPALPDVAADRKRLRQVLVNLVSNAGKFTTQGRISILARSDRPDCVTVEVADTGIGIAEPDLRQLFRPFSQVHRGNPGEYGGTGLGLAISRRLTRKMGGDIEVRSTVGEGSTFSIRLPRAETPAERLAG